MQPIQINIMLDASPALLDTVQALTGSRRQAPVPERKPAPTVEHKPAPAPEVKEPAPEPPAPEPALEEITDEALRAVIKEVKNATSAKAVRDLFEEFGIRVSIECPQERRPELVSRLKQLAA